jgi:hypothetical protein
VQSVKSGTADGVLWVSVGFTSTAQPHDVLHVACAPDTDAGDGLYLERLDQAHSCYSGAHRIVVGMSSLEFHFTQRGTRCLDFPPFVRFSVLPNLRGWKSAHRALVRMSQRRDGSVIEVSS